MSLIQQFEDICTAVRNEMDMDFFKFWDDINKVSEDLGSNFCCLLWPLPKQTNGFLSGLSDFIYFVMTWTILCRFVTQKTAFVASWWLSGTLGSFLLAVYFTKTTLFHVSCFHFWSKCHLKREVNNFDRVFSLESAYIPFNENWTHM